MVDSTNLPEVDINQIATDLNNKADRDLVNSTASRDFFSGYDFTVKRESISTGQAYSLNLPKKINPKNYYVNAYAEVKTAANGFSVGDIIPWSGFWGYAYKNLSFWYNSTKIGFGTSNQVSCNKRGTSDDQVEMQSYIRVVFDFYKLRN